MRKVCTIICLVISLLFGLGTTRAEIETAPSITLDRPVHFTAVDGSDIHVAADTYRINQAGESRLRLLKEDGTAIEIQATPSTHEESISSPLGLAIVEEGREDDLHLILVLPDKHALDAVGSFSGTRSRAALISALKPMQLQSAINQINPPSSSSPTTPPQGVPPAGIVRVPASVASTATQPKSVQLGAGKWINWTYLQVNQPLLVAQILADVQAGRKPPSFVAGLTTPRELKEMMKTNWAAEAARLNAARQAAVTTRGLSAATLASPGSVASISQQQQPSSPVQREISTAPIPLLFPVPLNDLGAAYSGEHVRRSIILTSPVDGHLTAQLRIQDVRDKRFRIDEVISYTGEFKNGEPQRDRDAQGGDWNDIRPSEEDPSIHVSMAGYVTLDVKAGQLMYIVVAFEPHASIGPPVGRYEVPLQLTWHAKTGQVGSQTVPLRAYCNGIHFGLIAYAEQAYAITLTDRSVDYPIVVTNSGPTPISGSFSDLQLPSGVTMNPASVTVGPNLSQRAVLRFNVNSQSAQDGPNQDIAVSFNSGSGNRPINFSISIYHPWIWWCDGLQKAGSTECGPTPGAPGLDGYLNDAYSHAHTAGIGQVQVWIKSDGQWWWKIDTYNRLAIEVGGHDFTAVLSFAANRLVTDTINVHIGPQTDHQYYEHLVTQHPWISSNFLTAAQTGVTLETRD